MSDKSEEHMHFSWRTGPHTMRDDAPEKWVAATVPGAVQLDWARAHDWPDYKYGKNVSLYAGLEDRFWTYETRFTTPVCAAAERIYFMCGGIDYAYEILLNGDTVLRHEGMQTPIELDLTKSLRGGAENQLRIVIHPAPKSCASPPNRERTQANHSCKPAVSYGWDFHPRLIPLGIWHDAFLEIRPACFIQNADVGYELSRDFSSASLCAKLTFSVPPPEGVRVRWTLRAPDGAGLFQMEKACARCETVTLEARVENPELWWPHDQGKPALHTSTLEFLIADGVVADTRSQRIGFRSTRLVMAPGQWSWRDAAFPKTRAHPPVTLEINGRPLFVKGANWVSPEIFPALLSHETCSDLLRLVCDAHMHLVRIWGGAPAQKDFFYDLCDELGIMVWQEFPLACNCYPDDRDYLRVLDVESRSLIARLKPHASIILWCGGNELFNIWSGMTDQSLPLRLLASNCYQLDPARPFLPTSPIEGVGHGHYAFRDPKTGDEAWKLFQDSNCTAYTEFGVPGPASSLDIIKEIIPSDELFPPRPGGSWSVHHAFGAWMANSHLYPDVLEYYFGPSASLEQLLARAHLLQSEGLKGLYEEARRQKPNASMAMCWCLNEPWPAAANLSIISWPARPKPAYYAVAAACRPLLASARIRKFEWREGEIFDAQLWWLNDTRDKTLAPGPIEPSIETDSGKIFPLTVWHDAALVLATDTNRAGPSLQWVIPVLDGCECFTLVLATPARPEAASRYTLRYRSNKAENTPK